MYLTIHKVLRTSLFLAGFCMASAYGAEEVIRHPIPNSTFPISAAIEVPPNATVVYLSGQVPPLVDASQPTDRPKAYGGDTKAQTIGVFKEIEKSLKTLGLGLGDVVKMQVFLVGDPARRNQMDFSGFMEAYSLFFGTKAQPNLPVRSVVQVAGLANPAWRVEIEVIVVRPR